MKNILLALAVLLTVVILTACGSEEPAPILDFKSVLDTELNILFSLGDHRDDIESILGPPIRHNEEWGDFEYQNGLQVVYEGHRAVFLAARNGLEEGRFEVLGYSIGMSRSQISDYFEPRAYVAQIVYSFIKHYDSAGELTTEENAYVEAGVMLRESEGLVSVFVEFSGIR